MTTRKSPTMNDIARLAGVTAMTVSRALSGTGVVSDATRTKIEAAADELGYILDGTASAFLSRKSGFIAVVIPSLNNSNFAETVRGITDGLADPRLQVLLGATDYQIEQEERIVRSMLVRRPEAMVITDGLHSDRTRRMLENAAIPIVEMWGLPDQPIDSVVGFSNREAARQITAHLYAKGYRRIAFIGGTTALDKRGIERRKGYEDAVVEAGQASRAITHGVAPISMHQGADALAQLLALWPDTDAVVCVSDLLAFGVMAECQRRNISVPGTLAIAGFGNYDISQCSVPAITTVDITPRAIGEEVGRLLKEKLALTEATPQPTKRITTFQILDRAST